MMRRCGGPIDSATTRSGARRSALRLILAGLVILSLPACTAKYTYNRLDDAWFDGELQRGWKFPMEFGFAPPN